MTKRLIIIFILILVVTAMVSADSNFGGYGSTLTHLTILDGKFCTMWGAVGAFTVGDFAIGAFGIASPRSTHTHEIGDLNLYYGGLYLGYILPFGEKVQPRISLLSGYGAVYRLTGAPIEQEFEGNVWIFTPSVDALFNINNWFRIGAGGGWRIPVASPVESSRLSSWIVSLTFEFGGFKNS